MIRYCGPFLLLGSIPAFRTWLGDGGPMLTVALLLAFLIGAEFVAPRGDAAPAPAGRPFRALFFAYVPLQLGVIAWSIAEAQAASGWGFAALAFPLGVTTGVFGMLAAHELVHSTRRSERAIGACMLTGMMYRHFRIAHVHVHHRHAATARDSASARLGEGFYAFLIRAVPGQFLEAWRFEQSRPGRTAMFANRVLFDLAIAVAVAVAIVALSGLAGLVFFSAQSLVAIVVLELFNYVAHYGLARATGSDGRAEPLSDRHSWNSSNVLVNLMIFNMGRHSDHHRRPAASYEELRHRMRAPELPAGYAGSILLALVPPLWRRIMDREIARLCPNPTGEVALAA